MNNIFSSSLFLYLCLNMSGYNLSQMVVGGQLLELLVEKAVYIRAQNTVIIADVHLGKIEHFRNHGVAIPHRADHDTLDRMHLVLTKYKPSKVIFLGDLFHSSKNKSFQEFRKFLQSFSGVDFILVKGNHDIYSNDDYTDMGLQVMEELYCGALWLTHEPIIDSKPGYYNLSGHIHPGIRLYGNGKQSISLPCFVFYSNYGILPAFGYFTGKAIIKGDKKSTIFAVTDTAVIPLSS